MADERKRIIIEEINYWKNHKLLSEKQCDFLLALYTQGQGEDYKIHTKYEKVFLIYLPLLILLVPLSVIIMYFTQVSDIMQISLLILFFSFAWLSYFIFKRHDFQYTFIALLIALILMLLMSVYLTNKFFPNQFLVPIVILINFASWFITGRRIQHKILQIISITSFIFTCIYIIFKFT